MKVIDYFVLRKHTHIMKLITTAVVFKDKFNNYSETKNEKRQIDFLDFTRQMRFFLNSCWKSLDYSKYQPTLYT